jgi:hypothetical protein
VNGSLQTGPPSDIAQEILAFLIEHPKAQDTLEGIMQWWLLEQGIKRYTAKVQAALGELVVQGLVLEWRGRDERIHYRINASKVSTIRELLDGWGRASKHEQ